MASGIAINVGIASSALVISDLAARFPKTATTRIIVSHTKIRKRILALFETNSFGIRNADAAMTDRNYK